MRGTCVSQFERRPFGSTGMELGVLGFGAMELRGEGHNKGRAIGAEQAITVLNTALDLGVNFIDTSPDYGGSEELIGEAIGRRREEFFLATKVGCPIKDEPSAPRPLVHDYARENIVAVLERSLTRLRTDHVDLLQIHAHPTRDQLEKDDTIATLHQLRDAGKVRFIGSSSALPAVQGQAEMGVLDSFQVPFSALQREHGEFISDVGSQGAGVIVRGSVGQGAPRPDLPWAASWDAWDRGHLDELLDGESRPGFLLRWALAHPGVGTAIVGTMNPDHLRSNAESAARGPLSPDVYAEARRRLEAVSNQTV